MKCEAYTIPSTYLPMSAKCSKDQSHKVTLARGRKGVCHWHLAEFQRKGQKKAEEMFAVRRV